MGAKNHGLQYLANLAQFTPQDWRRGIEVAGSVLKALGDPQDCVRTVHVAGTNGKGSVSAATAAMLAKTGAKIGLTTSPHLIRQNERIVINGKPIEDGLLDEFSTIVAHTAYKLGAKLSYFQAITITAFLAFRELGLDWVVAEVGLGGRLDTTNLISRPDIGCIVTIDYDHEELLGPTLGAIAAEKAGIIKPGMTVSLGHMQSEAIAAIRAVAAPLRGNCRQLGVDFCVAEGLYKSDQASIDLNSGLLGSHQLSNLAVAADMARQIGLSSDQIEAGLRDLFWPARLERVQYQGKDVIIDSAHNPAGIKSLTDYLKATGIRPALCFGALRTKRWQEMVVTLNKYVSNWFILEPASPNSVPNIEVRDFLTGIGVSSVDLGDDYARAIDCLTSIPGNSPVLFAGSMYMVGKVRGLLNLPERPIWGGGEATDNQRAHRVGNI